MDSRDKPFTSAKKPVHSSQFFPQFRRSSYCSLDLRVSVVVRHGFGKLTMT